MSIYATLIGTIAGICLGYGLLYLFAGLRRGQDKQLNLLFALFAFGYAGTLLLGVVYRSQTTVEAYLAISRWDGIFIWMAFIGLNWYVAEYTAGRYRFYLWSVSALFTLTIAVLMLTPTLAFAEMPSFTTIPLPWPEEVPTLAGEENLWGTLLLLLQLATLVFIIVAGVRQWRRGARQAAGVLLGGMSWFIIALGYEIGAELGLWVYIPFAESGFLGIAIALALQMADSVIRTEKALARHQDELETLVQERTAEVQVANQLLLEQERVAATAEERRRLASELHDSVTQTLYSVSLVAAALPRLLERNVDEAKLSATHLRNMTLGALAEMRTLLYELRPEAFVTAQLATLLQQAADVFTGRTHIPVDVLVTADPRLATETKRALYRITQEALNNTAKHGEASGVAIELTEQSDAYTLCIQDDGRGFGPEAEQGEGFGLRIMRERAGDARIKLDIASTEDIGTVITATWPNTHQDW